MLAANRLYSKCLTDYAQLEYTKINFDKLHFLLCTTNKIKLFLKMLINWHSNFFSKKKVVWKCALTCQDKNANNVALQPVVRRSNKFWQKLEYFT